MHTKSEAGHVDVRVVRDGRLTHRSLHHHLVRPDGARTLLDLTHLTFIDPAGLVALAAVAEHARHCGRDVRVLAPVDWDCRSYVSRMRFGAALADLGIDHDLPPVTELDPAARLVELRRFETAAGLNTVIEALVQTFLTDLPGSLQPLYAAISEIAANVLQHSGKAHGHVALQRFPRTGVVDFAVSDSGMGLRASLSKSREVPDDRVAVSLAARRHESSVLAAGRGQGISRVIETAKHHRGEVRLISGTAAGVFGHGLPNPQIADVRLPLPGTVVHVRLSLEGAAP